MIWPDWAESLRSPKSPAEGRTSQRSADMSLWSKSIPQLRKYSHLSPQLRTPSSSPSSLILASIYPYPRCSSLQQSSVHPPNTACCAERQSTAHTLKKQRISNHNTVFISMLFYSLLLCLIPGWGLSVMMLHSLTSGL